MLQFTELVSKTQAWDGIIEWAAVSAYSLAVSSLSVHIATLLFLQVLYVDQINDDNDDDGDGD